MKAQAFTRNHQRWIDFTAESPDDIFVLGQMSRTMPVSVKGFTIESKIALQVLVDDVVKKLIEPVSEPRDD